MRLRQAQCLPLQGLALAHHWQLAQLAQLAREGEPMITLISELFD